MVVKTNFENLQIYQLAETLSDMIWKIVIRWENFAKDTVGKQLVRAVDSIGANIAEGSGKGTAQDNRRYLRHARGSLYETRHWIHRAIARGLVSPTQAQEITLLMDELIPKLNAYMRTLNTQIRNQSS